jgi:hypothetical protein
VPKRLVRAELPRLQIFWRRLWLEKFGTLRSRAKLAIASFVVHYLGSEALFLGHLPETVTIRLSGFPVPSAPNDIPRP